MAETGESGALGFSLCLAIKVIPAFTFHFLPKSLGMTMETSVHYCGISSMKAGWVLLNGK